MNTGGNAGGAISPYLTPFLSDLIAGQYGADVGWRIALAVAGVIVFAGGGLWWMFIPSPERSKSNCRVRPQAFDHCSGNASFSTIASLIDAW